MLYLFLFALMDFIVKLKTVAKMLKIIITNKDGGYRIKKLRKQATTVNRYLSPLFVCLFSKCWGNRMSMRSFSAMLWSPQSLTSSLLLACSG